ncbi:MAG: hypothetical protein ACI4SH_01075 [Candidatus Scatosoma sp.]
MSKNYPEKEVDVDALTQEELEAIANDEAETETSAPKKRIFSRILAVLLALAPIALVCFLPVSLFLYDAKYVFTDKITLLTVFKNIFRQDGVQAVYEAAGIAVPANVGAYAFHKIPLLNAAGTCGKVFSWFIYAFPVVFLLNIVFMLIGVCSVKKAPAMVRTISFTDLLLFGGYALMTLFLSGLYADKPVYDVVVLSCAGAGLLFFAVYAIVANKEKISATLILHLLAFALLGLYVLTIFKYDDRKQLLPLYIVVVACVGAAVLFFITYSACKRKGRVAVPLILLLLTLAFVGTYAFAIFKYDLREQLLAWYNADEIIAGSFTWGRAFKYIVRGMIGLYALSILVSVIRLVSKKGYGFDIFRYCLHLILALAVVGLCFFDLPFTKGVDEKALFAELKWFAVAAAGIALVQMIICIIAKHVIKAKAAALAEEEADEENDAEATEYAQVTEEDATEAAGTVAAQAATEAVAEEETAPEEPDVSEPTAMPAWMNASQVQPEPEPEPAAEEEQLVIPNFSSFRDDTEELEEAPAPTMIPVAPAENADETENAATAPVAPVAPAPAAYDYYNSKSFDPFIASLNDKEREQFTDLFILKYQGTMKNLPDYTVGGNNDEFFRKVFIYLGQYRDRIPDGLLAKMYKFCIKR